MVCVYAKYVYPKYVYPTRGFLCWLNNTLSGLCICYYGIRYDFLSHDGYYSTSYYVGLLYIYIYYIYIAVLYYYYSVTITHD